MLLNVFVSPFYLHSFIFSPFSHWLTSCSTSNVAILVYGIFCNIFSWKLRSKGSRFLLLQNFSKIASIYILIRIRKPKYQGKYSLSDYCNSLEYSCPLNKKCFRLSWMCESYLVKKCVMSKLVIIWANFFFWLCLVITWIFDAFEILSFQFFQDFLPTV